MRYEGLSQSSVSIDSRAKGLRFERELSDITNFSCFDPTDPLNIRSASMQETPMPGKRCSATAAS